MLCVKRTELLIGKYAFTAVNVPKNMLGSQYL
jgi:hypothetical protein